MSVSAWGTCECERERVCERVRVWLCLWFFLAVSRPPGMSGSAGTGATVRPPTGQRADPLVQPRVLGEGKRALGPCVAGASASAQGGATVMSVASLRPGLFSFRTGVPGDARSPAAHHGHLRGSSPPRLREGRGAACGASALICGHFLPEPQPLLRAPGPRAENRVGRGRGPQPPLPSLLPVVQRVKLSGAPSGFLLPVGEVRA